MRTLGLYQPFAGLMLHGKIETRWVQMGKKPPFPLDNYALYATIREYSKYETWNVAGNQFPRVCEMRATGSPEFAITGHIIATGNLHKVEPLQPSEIEKAFVEPRGVDFEPGQGLYITYRENKKGKLIAYVLWALHYQNVQGIEPIPFKGKQGVGFLPAEIEAKIVYKPKSV